MHYTGQRKREVAGKFYFGEGILHTKSRRVCGPEFGGVPRMLKLAWCWVGGEAGVGSEIVLHLSG